MQSGTQALAEMLRWLLPGTICRTSGLGSFGTARRARSGAIAALVAEAGKSGARTAQVTEIGVTRTFASGKSSDLDKLPSMRACEVNCATYAGNLTARRLKFSGGSRKWTQLC